VEEWTIRSLIDELNRLTKLYDEGHPEISDKKWDDLYFKLKQMEKETGIIYPDSPTHHIYFESVSKLEKVKHNHPMLSLDKTKNIEDIKSFVNGHSWIAMAKLDGLTCSLKYMNGKLVSAETRGNGIEGEDITHNAKVISSIPQTINYKKELVVDGEVICTYEDFEQFKNDYKNPRNFASGSIRLLDSEECQKRYLTFIAWDCFCDDHFYDNYLNYPFNTQKTLSLKLQILKDLGFIIVLNITDIDTISIDLAISSLKENSSNYPIDGIVFKYDDIEEYNAAGRTDHHFKGGLAYKFYDETYSTRLKYIQWTMGRTGVLTPVAVFDPIDIDGSTVERASLHNVSVMKEILGDCAYVGEHLQVYKANQIIPQIAEAGPKYDYGYVIAHAGVSANDVIERCPICGGDIAYITSDDGVINAYCDNPLCEGKLINRLEHFCGKKGLDIKGLSKATFQKLIDWEWMKNIEDIFYLSNHRNEWVKKPGFGIASVDKILKSIEEHKRTTLDAFISAIGIPLIGRAVAKDLINYFETYEDFRNAVNDKDYHFYNLNNFGEEMDNSIKNFDYTEADKIFKLLIFESPIVNNNKINDNLAGKTIVITGKLTNFKNRAELKSVIEAHGGKVVDSISAKTDILINNDVNSTSSKNKTAQARNIPIISELDFIQQYIEN
jgi:DNA ligase (NAD+)